MKVLLVIIFILFFYITNINIEKETIKTTTEKFTTNVELDYKIFNTKGGTRNVFVPILGNSTYEEVKKYKEIFNIKGNVEENDIYYKVIDDKTKNYICVYKKLNLIKYVENENENKNSINYIDNDGAINIANEFLNKYNFNLTYTEINVKEFEFYYDVYYVNILDNMNNHSFLNYVRLDKKGNIIYFKYYDINYKKLGDIEIINEKTAYNKLLDEYSPIYKTSISSCELIYLYKDNVCMPHFVFKGSNEIGEIVEIFINAKK